MQGSWLRRLAKGAAEHGLSAVTNAPIVRNLSSGRRVVLAYHNVISDEEPLVGERSLHLRAAVFRKHLDLIQEWCSVLALDELMDADPAGTSSSPRVALTFDDAYAGAIRIALPELDRREFPATVFVPTGLIGTESFWWDAVKVTPVQRSRDCLDRFGGNAASITHWATQQGLDLSTPPPNQRPATWVDLRGALAYRGVLWGAHSVSHPVLPHLSDEQLWTELKVSKERLEALPFPTSGWTAYPYGLVSPRVKMFASQVGYRGGLLIDGGAVPQIGGDMFGVPRISVPSGATAENVLLRIRGVLDPDATKRKLPL